MNRNVKHASEGHYYTNGETYVKTVELPLDADETVWYEITEEAYQIILEEQLKAMEEEFSM